MEVPLGQAVDEGPEDGHSGEVGAHLGHLGEGVDPSLPHPASVGVARLVAQGTRGDVGVAQPAEACVLLRVSSSPEPGSLQAEVPQDLNQLHGVLGEGASAQTPPKLVLALSSS
jgi:hypothetical protein